MNAMDHRTASQEASANGSQNDEIAERNPSIVHLWLRVRKLEHDNNQAAGRICRLEADLHECLEYLETQVDVVDGDYGEPAPNRAMQLVAMIDQSLGEWR